jgi:hypothetical protein
MNEITDSFSATKGLCLTSFKSGAHDYWNLDGHSVEETGSRTVDKGLEDDVGLDTASKTGFNNSDVSCTLPVYAGVFSVRSRR